MSRIFISYKRVDKDKVFRIKDQIESALGEKCWIDLDGIESDAQFINVIIKAIRKCEVLLFMYSKTHTQITNFEKDWTVRELNFASKKEKRIVFVNIDGSPLSDEFEFLYGTKQQVDGQSQESLSRLQKDLATWLGNLKVPSTNDRRNTNNPSDSLQSPKRIGKKLSQYAKGVVDTVKNVDSKFIENGQQIFSSYKENSDTAPLENDKINIGLEDLSFNMIRVEGGSLKVGATKEQLVEADNNEYPEHIITLPTYYISEFPITQNLWEAVMGYNKSRFHNSEHKNTKNHLYGAIKGAAAGSILGPLGMAAGAVLGNKYLKGSDIKGHYPAENLSHDEALEFVRRLSNMTNLTFSLPTEQEWEYAARGGQKSKGYKYAGGDDIDEVAWNKNNAGGHTHPVGEKQPNELGLYDMCGNVWEWTETPAHSYSDNDSIHNGDVYIRRGGSWWHEPTNCRVSKRYASDKSKKTSGLGLRVVIRLNHPDDIDAIHKQIQQLVSYNINGVDFNMIRVPSGLFSMGATPEQSEPDDNEFPIHKVKISKDYYLGETPVTQALWNVVMEIAASGSEEPITDVSWNECQTFIKKLNQQTGMQFRLPTEAEWEYAARGGNKSHKYPFSGSNVPNKVAWYYENSNGHKHIVKLKIPNELGLYDMSGNVMEWCKDWYANYEEGIQVDPQGPSDGFEKIIRGGSWDDDATMCGTSARDRLRPDESDDNIGFRLALTMED